MKISSQKKYRRGKLLNILKFFGKDIDMQIYKDRLILQKLIYLLDSKGVEFNYNFGWYVRGPYSSSLASDGYALSEKKYEEVELSQNETKIIKKIRKDLGCDVKDDRKMETLASLLFLKREEPSITHQELEEKLKSLKPWLSHREIKEARKKIGLLET